MTPKKGTVLSGYTRRSTYVIAHNCVSFPSLVVSLIWFFEAEAIRLHFRGSLYYFFLSFTTTTSVSISSTDTA